VYVDDVNILDRNINTIKRHREALSLANREGGLEVSTENFKHIIVFCNHNIEQNYD
jgi:hypothetical protein